MPYKGHVLRTYLDGRVFGERTGSAEPHILALHGWGRTRDDFVDVLGERSALIVDLPGFGASQPPERALSTAGYADLLAPLLADMPSPRTVVGHSFGGRVALQLAARSGQVDRLMLVGTPLLRRAAPRPSALYLAVRWAAAKRLVPRTALEGLRERRGSADYRAASGVMRDVLVAAVNESYEDQLQEVRCPTLIISGEHDTAAPPALAREAAALLTNGTVAIVPSAGHLLDAGLSSEIQRQLDQRGWAL